MSAGPREPREICDCRCETCLDTECTGHVCGPHSPGRWLIKSPWMAHPYPSDFESEVDARAFIDASGIRHLDVEVQP